MLRSRQYCNWQGENNQATNRNASDITEKSYALIQL